MVLICWPCRTWRRTAAGQPTCLAARFCSGSCRLRHPRQAWEAGVCPGRPWRPDVSAFDFTSMMRAESSARVQRGNAPAKAAGLVGDCLGGGEGSVFPDYEGWLSGFRARRHGDSLVR